jgi:hypothetical protein
LPALARRIPTALILLVVIAVGLRWALWRTYQPAVMNPDTVTYVGMAAAFGLFTDPVRTAGYSMFLQPLHFVSSDVEFTLAIQHLLGIGSGLLLYATVRRIGAPQWVAITAAASILLPIDQIVLEHSVMSETLFTLLLIGMLYACVRALDPPTPIKGAVTSRVLWILAAGVLLGFSVWVRAVSAPLIPFLGLWFVFCVSGRWLDRIGRAALAAGGAAAIVILYFSLNAAATGYFGLVQGSGWMFYGRTAPFADCDRFDPPDGTARLCEETPPEERPEDPYGYRYVWSSESPAHQAFGLPPARNDEVSAFAWAALTHQPVDYLKAVSSDVLRYFGFGLSSEHFDVTRIRLESAEEGVTGAINSYYADEQVGIGDGLGTLEELQRILRVHPHLLFAGVILGLLGLGLGRGPVRAALALLIGVGLLLVIIPSVTAVYTFRYALPANGPLLAAGAIGLSLVAGNLVVRRRRPVPQG